MDRIISRHLRIHGRVQGVGYRNYIEFKAAQHGVGGWVRNRADGSVEAVVCGAPEAVAELIECARRGPRASAVERVDIGESGEQHQTFSRRPTT
jgi:acylphosphatase